MPIPSRLLACSLLLLLLTACGAVVPPGRSFETTAVDFMQRLRWMDYHEAARHMAPEHRQDFLRFFTPLADLHITDVRLLSADPGPEGRIITSSELEYYLLPSTTVRTFPFQLEWAYETAGKKIPGTWRITVPFPELPVGRGS